MSFLRDVAEERERNCPVRAAIKAKAADILAARSAGQPLNAIYRALRRKGHPVGKGYSSFRTAVRYLDQHGWPSGDSAANDVVASPVMRDRFADDRNPSDF